MCVSISPSRARRNRLLASAATAALLSLTASGAQAQQANVTPANVEVDNLLAPFLTLNSTAVGQATLTANLNSAVTINTTSSTSRRALAMVDQILPSSASNTLTTYLSPGVPTTYATNYGVASNLAGVIPGGPTVQGVTPQQTDAGLGTVLGAIYVQGVNAYAAGNKAVLPNTVNLLTSAYNFTGSSVGAKSYFGNGTTNGTTTAVAPAGTTLPTFNGLPNSTNSVYDQAYGVANTQAGQNPFGDSRPYQVAPSRIDNFYSNYNAVLATNSAFPSGHTNYAFTDGVLLAMLVPQQYQSMMLRADQYGVSRMVLGAHYPLDVIASRSFSAEQLAQAFTNPAYINNAATTGTALNLPSLFTAASGELNAYLTANLPAGCGATVTACATSSANANGLSPSAANAATYAADLSYGLPTLSYTAAPREKAPAGGPDASILLATVYGGSTSAAKTLAPNGGIDGALSTDTINQIVVNTEGQAISAFYGTSLSYWSRINLYAASGYFSGVTGVLNTAASDVVSVPVTVASGGTLVDNGKIAGAVTVQSGGLLGGVGSIVGALGVQSGGRFAPGVYNASGVATGPGLITVNGDATLAAGSTYGVQIGASASSAKVSGTATLGGAGVAVNFNPAGSLASKYTILSAGAVSGTFGAIANSGPSANIVDSISYSGNSATLNVGLNYAQSGALTANQAAVAGALSGYLASNGSIPVGYVTLSPSDLGQASGEAATAVQRNAFAASDAFVNAFLDGGAGDPGVVGAPANANAALSYAAPPTRKAPALAAIKVAPAFAPVWTVWSAGYGGSLSIGGAGGANGVTDRAFGGLVGLGYRATPDTAFGLAAGAGGANFSLGGGAGSGSSYGVQFGGFARHDFGPLYVLGALAFGDQALTTNRNVGGSALQARFHADTLVGRLEIGDRFATPLGEVTPYGALQVTNLYAPGYGETALSGNGAFALNYGAQNVTDPRTELGLRAAKSLPLGDALLTLDGRLAWAHDFNPTPNLTATFQSLPGASFVVNGAAPAANSALTSAGARVKWANGFAAAVAFEGEFASNVRSYGGRGTLSYSW